MTLDTAIDVQLVASGIAIGFSVGSIALSLLDIRRRRRENRAATERARGLGGVVMSNHPPRVLRFPPPGAKR